jgi:hypothetical protein
MAPHPQRVHHFETLIDAVHHKVERLSPAVSPEDDAIVDAKASSQKLPEAPADDLEVLAGIDYEAEALLGQELDEMESFFEMGF